jgi:thermitase
MKNGSSANKGQFQKTGTSILGIIVVLTMILSSCAPAGLGSVDQPNFSTSNDDTLENSNPASSPSVTNTPSPAEIPYEPIKEPVVISVPEEPVPAQVVIQFNKDATEEEKEAYLEEIGGVIVEDIDSLDTVIVSVPEEIASNPLPLSSAITQTESDYYVSALDSIPNDPQYSEQWALSTIGAASAWGKLPIDAEKIRIAVIDSGICSTHPDLDGRIVAGWDFVEGDSIPQDEFGHGCAVAGIIAANMNDSLGIAGIAPNAHIMPLRALDENGIGTYSNVAAAIVYAADHDAQIINVSLGGSNSSSIMENAINYAISKDVIIVAAAGNSGTQGALYPAAYQGVIAVGSIDPNLQHSRFSNYGPQIDIWAPGRDILSVNLEGGYELFSGTSFSAPHVAGAKAMELALGTPLIVGSNVLSFVVVPSPTDIPDNTSITLTPLPTLAPIDSPVDTASAGNGTLFRTQVKLKYPVDQARLEDWGIKILSTGDRTAVIQATDEQLEKLARLGFEPTQIDSVEYMLAVQSSASVTSMSLSEVTASSTEMMALASVDSDSDGLTDTEETWWCTNPSDNNSDSALAPSTGNPSDGDEVQAILNGITSYGPPFALWPQFTPHNPNGNCPDGDYDAVPDSAEEFVLGSSILRESTDLDKFDDGQEFFGRTYCPAPSGPCGYGFLPRAEDSAYVTSLMPSFVLAPGNDPFVAAFPEPEVNVASSSLVMTQKTVITNTKGTTVGTEKTYGTSNTTGTSSSSSDTVTWNNWQEVSTTRPDVNSSVTPLVAKALEFLGTTVLMCGVEQYVNGENICVKLVKKSANDIGQAVTTYLDYKRQEAEDFARQVQSGDIDFLDALFFTGNCYPGLTPFSLSAQSEQLSCTGPANGVHSPTSEEAININLVDIGNQNSIHGRGDFSITTNNPESTVQVQNSYRAVYPAILPVPTTTITRGESHGGAYTTTHAEYEEQTISESSTNQYSDNWSTATAVDSTHAADLRFTYSVVNNGTEYAREVTNLTFNIYIGNNPNPIETYVAINGTTKPKIQNLFPGDSVTYTSEEIWLTLDEMRAIDEGAPIRIVMEDISFGQDQVFYQDALNGSVLLAMEDGFDDSDETIDSFLIPVWNPTDTVQDIAKRYFPVTEDAQGNLLSIFTPEFNTNPPTFVEHSLTGTSWWNIYLSDGLTYVDAFKDTTASPNSSVLIRIVTDSDLDGYNNRNEIRIGTDPDDPASHPSPNLVAGYTKSCTGNDCTVRMAFQNLGNYDAYGVEAIMYTPDGQVNITNNTIGGSGRVNAGEKVIVSASDTFQYTKTVPSPKEPVIVVSYNDPQGNHRFILPASALLTTLNDNIAPLNGQMLPDPGVDIASTSATNANFVIFSPHAETITNGKLFVEYIDAQGNVIHEDVFTQNFASGPTVVPVSINTGIYPPESTILLAFFTDAQGNIIDSSARPLASFGADPLPEANVTTSDIEIGAQGVVEVPNPWNFGTVESGTTLYANITLGNTGMGDLRYSLSGWGNGVSVMGVSSGSLSASNTRQFSVTIDTAGLPNGAFSKTLTLRTNDPNHAIITINLTGTIGTPAGTATAYQVTPYQPWNQFVYVPGPRNQNDIINFNHTFTNEITRMHPLYLFTEDQQTIMGIGEFGLDVAGQNLTYEMLGNGQDGDRTIGNGQTLNPIRAIASGTQNSTTLAISGLTGGSFIPNQKILIHQSRGTNAGVWEINVIQSVNVNQLTLLSPLKNTYMTDAGANRAQVLWIPQYRNLTIPNGVTLSVTSWDGNTGGIVAAQVSQSLLISGTVTANGSNGATTTNGQPVGGNGGFRGGLGDAVNNDNDGSGQQGEGTNGPAVWNIAAANGNGGGAGHGNAVGTGGGGGNGSAGSSSTGGGVGFGGSSAGNINLTNMVFGGGGGGSTDNPGNSIGGGGGGGGIIFLSANNLVVTGTISANGGQGGGDKWAGGGGAGGSILLKGFTVTLGNNLIVTNGGAARNNGGAGGLGRIRIEYCDTASGATIPVSTPVQIDCFTMKQIPGLSTTELIVPETILVNQYERYKLLYGQRSLNTSGGNQLFAVQFENRQYSSVTLSTLIEKVVGSGSSFNFCLDFGNDGICDYTANNQSFTVSRRLDSSNLANALNAYITSLGSSAPVLTIPIRVNINTQADVFLFNLSSTAISGVDLQASTPGIAPQNGNAANNILEGSLVDLSATVTNNGSNEASDFIVAFYLGDPANGGTLIGSKFISSLAPGATSPAQTVTWNTSGLLGSKTIYVKADSSSTIGESNEANNTASAPAVIKKKPDLTILSIQAPNLRAGETGSASVTVKNDGQFDVTGAVVRLYLGTDANGTVLGNVNVNVPQGQSVIAQISFSVSTAGNKNLFVKADPSNVIPEANEQNNTAAGNITIGWNLLTVDAGGANDTSYSLSTGYGWLAQGQGTTSTSCGTQLQQSYRQAGSTETLQYQFDNLIPGRHYHLDVTFATCSGERYLDLFVDGTQMTEAQAGALPGTGNLPIYVNNSPQTISLLLDPASYESDGSVTLSISRNLSSSGLYGPLVNIIDLQEVKYCYMDSGPNETPWSASNDCGYDPSWSSDSFNGWGTLPYETMRFGDGSVNYKFSNLIPTKKYTLRTVYYEEDSAGRIQRVTFDGASPSATFTLGSTAMSYIMPIPAASYSDGQLIVAIERPAGGEAVINEIILEEDSRLENNRYNTPAAAFNKSAPLNTATDQSVNTTLSWAASSGATSYEYCYDTTNDNSCSNWLGNGMSTSKTFSGLEAGTTYYWHVRALKGSTITYANGSATAFWSFTTAASSNGAFNKSSPANGAPNQSTSPTLSWGISNGATLYEYCYDTTNDNSCSNWTGNGTSTSKALSGLSTGTTYYWHVRAVNGGVITYSNTNAFWSFTVISDNTPPTVTSIIRASTNPTSATSVDFNVTFSEAVQNVDTNGSDFTLFTSGVTGASITGVSGSGSTRTVTVNTGSGNGSIRLDVPNTATIKDIYNNDLSGLPFTNGESYAIEKIIAPPNHTVTFDANGGSGSMGNQVANIPTALTANTFTYSGYSFTGWNTAANSSGTSYANGATYPFDADVTLYAQWVVAPPPHVNSITRASTNPSSAASVDFTVTFSEDVTGISTSDPLEDFELYTTGVSGAFITTVSGSGSVYTVTVNTGSGNGTIRLDIPDTATIFASSNNAPIELPYRSGEEYTILKTTSATFKSSAANDGWITESSETSNSGGVMNSTNLTLFVGDATGNKQIRAILHFDTSSLPDNAVVTNMTLKVKQQGAVTGVSPFTFGSLYVDMRNPAFGSSALELADFNFAAKKVKSAVFNPNPVSGWFSARFNTGGRSYVNRTGVTQLRLYFSVDDNDNNIADFIRFHSGNAAAGDRPKLVIQYYVP